MVNLWVIYGQSMDNLWWFFAYPSEKYEFVNWDDDIPIWKNHEKQTMFQTTNQINYTSLKKKNNYGCKLAQHAHANLIMT